MGLYISEGEITKLCQLYINLSLSIPYLEMF
jgi:hypothetical protein